MSSPVLILPGYGDSGPTHWQTIWQEQHPEYVRVVQRNWDEPRCTEWVEKLEAAVRDSGPSTILVAHSLGCLLVAHWAATSQHNVAGALLVAPPDPLAAAFPPAIQGFAPVPLRRIPFPTVLVASNNDPYATPAFTAQCATAWGSDLVEIGPAGHINSASGLGDWPKGQKLLAQLRASLA